MDRLYALAIVGEYEGTLIEVYDSTRSNDTPVERFCRVGKFTAKAFLLGVENPQEKIQNRDERYSFRSDIGERRHAGSLA